MPRPHLPSHFLTTGLLLALLLTVLVWGFQQAPEAARQTLLPPPITPLVEVEPIRQVGPTEGFAELYLEEQMEQEVRTELIYATSFLFNDCSIQRPRPELPPVDELTLPIYPGCEQEANYEERVFCGFKRLAAFIDANKVEPAGSQRERVGISFVIHRETGLILDVDVIAGQDQRNIEEALRIVNLLVERGVRWTPGTRSGEVVNFPMAIPISFHGAGCGE